MPSQKTRSEMRDADTERPVYEEPPDPTITRVLITRPESELGPGMMVGDYRIEARIGEGGMGVVFSAVHPLISKRAAIKVLRKELCTDPGAIERLIDEARVVNEIGHPNLVDVFAFGQLPDGRHYMVMEWLKGETLRSRIARGPSSFEEICGVLRPLARALEAAHEAGVVHRDLKPDNVFLVDVRGELPLVKLLDFGIAKLANTDHRSQHTANGTMLGTPQYIAPEQARGEGVDHRADIYALGGLAFELLTGRPPFQAETAMEVVVKHLMIEPVRPSSLTSEIPEELDELIVNMLAKDAAARPTLATFQLVIERLRTAAREPTRPTAVAAPTTTLVIAAPKRRAWLLAAAILVIAVVAGVVIATSNDASLPTREARAPQAIPAPPAGNPSPIKPPTAPVHALPETVVSPEPVVEPSPPAAEPEPAVVEPETITTVARSRLKPTSKPRAPRPSPPHDVAPPPESPPQDPPPPRESLAELNMQGTDLYVKGKFAAAEQVFKHALSIDRSYAPAYHGLGVLYQHTGETRKAVDALRMYLKLSPNAKDATKIRARITELEG